MAPFTTNNGRKIVGWLWSLELQLGLKVLWISIGPNGRKEKSVDFFIKATMGGPLRCFDTVTLSIKDRSLKWGQFAHRFTRIAWYIYTVGVTTLTILICPGSVRTPQKRMRVND